MLKSVVTQSYNKYIYTFFIIFRFYMIKDTVLTFT